MKRFLIVAMVFGLVAGSVATAEAKRRQKPTRVERTIEGEYNVVPEPLTECWADRGNFGCMVVDVRPTEAFFTAKVSDSHGQPVFVQVVAEGFVKIGTFCGETTEPIPFDPGTDLEFVIEPTTYFWSNWGAEWLGPLDCPYRAATSGTISVTLSNLP